MKEMNLSDLIAGLPIRRHAGPPGLRIRSVVESSPRAGRGALFVARPGGRTHGKKHVPDALARGAAAVLSDQPVEAPPGVATLVAQNPADTAITLANRLHGYPADRLRLIGVTGTNGKTTTAWMIRHLLAAAGHRCGMIGTIETDDGRSARPAALTTPFPVDLIALFHDMVRNGCDTAVMEVSSHALHQGRVAMLDFDTAVFTNLSGDHLDYHHGMEQYAAAKAMLFDSLREDARAVVNEDDPAAPRMMQDCRARRLSFGLRAAGADCRADIHRETERGAAFDAVGPWGRTPLRLPLIGRHNVANMLAALAAVHTIGGDVPALADAVARCPAVPGRLEPVLPDNAPAPPFRVFVDYAHTDDALENVLRALRPVTRGRLRVLFGCGGDRDPAKRPRMAAVACRLADDVIITSDNPREEDPGAIIAAILTGVGAGDRNRVRTLPDRRRAIHQIIADARPGDLLLLAGKGHENEQIIGARRRPFDDRAVAREALEKQSPAPPTPPAPPSHAASEHRKPKTPRPL